MPRLATIIGLLSYCLVLAALPASADVQVPPLSTPQYSYLPERTGSIGESVLDDFVGREPAAAAYLQTRVSYGTSSGRSGRQSVDAAWSAGLAAWRSGDYGAAAELFEAVAENGRSEWFAAGGAFWAARAHLFAHQPQAVTRWLSVAAEAPETFYGLLARRILGLPMPFQWDLTEADVAALAAIDESAEGQRALALINSGDYERAERLLRGLAASGRTDLGHGAMIVAERAGMADLAFRLQRMLAPYGIEFDRAAYPLPRWRPEGGFSTDRALVYALMRQESNFNPGAVSAAGARGVMQLMPATARFVARASGFPGGAAQFRRPEVNIALGERYLEMLLADDSVGPDLFLLTAAWNGGPANVERWRRDVQTLDDPLLFIETIPFGETRAFIEHVLANLWIYRHRLGIDSPSLDSLAAGRWPNWDVPEQTAVEIAEHE
ncbi:MAG: lytic transglycosylase domain-containing protein [Rhodospirillales bacterium]|nr:lytic transglycosylase domain-containing protein [Rhodospirillales bacterium]